MQFTVSHQFSQRQSMVVTQQLRQAIVLLQMGNTELESFIEAQSSENPFVELGTRSLPPPPLPGTGAASRGDDWDRIAALPDDAGPSLYAHVAAQMAAMGKDEAETRLATAFLEALEPSGWLGATPEDIALRCGSTESEAEDMLARLQALDPAGVFARNLAECLTLQAQDQGLLTPLFARVLANLPLVAAADLAGLARACGCQPGDLRPVLRDLRSLDPKPGTRFDGRNEPVRQPDLIISAAVGGGWQVDLNRSTLPSVVVRLDEARRLTPASRDKTTAGYVAERLSVARWLSRAVEHRNRTVLKIGEQVAKRQMDFLARGPAHLRPMILREVAEAAGVHESTVSRVSNGIMVATPHGTFPLKRFFSAALPSRDEAGGSAGAVRHRIERIIRGEPADRPLSDDHIVKLLEAEGVQVARRTVAKYREQLNIPSSSMRRRQAILTGRA